MRLFPSLRIAQKLPMILIGSVLVAGLGIGVAGFVIGLETVKAQRQEALRASVHASFNQVTDYFAVLESDLTLMASRSDTVGALDVLAYAFTKESFTGASAEALQAAYVEGNPNPDGQRYKFDSAERAGKDYDTQHRRYHPAFRDMMVARGYSDVMLFDAAGNLVYSTAKEADFALNFAAGSDLAKTGLGQAFGKAKSMPAGVLSFIDFAAYAPVAGAPRAFVATGIFKDSVMIGVAAIAIAPDALSTRLQSVKGLGKTGEVLIVGRDNLLRTDSVFSDTNDVLTTTLPPDLMASAINGTGSSPAALSYRGIKLAIANLSFGFKGVKWQIVAVQSEEEILAPVVTMGTTMAAIGGGFLLLAAAAGFWFTRSITKPVTRLTRSMAAIAGGDLDVDVAGAKRRDELGAMAQAVEVFRRNSRRVIELNAEQIAAGESHRSERAEMMEALQRAFGEVVDAAVAGDFSRRVAADFPDEELNALARSVNLLVETVDRGVSETGEVLAALADTDLTRRMEGEYEGAFAKLKDDTNAVVDALRTIVGQLHQTSRALKTATGEILSGSDDLAKRTSRQAATIEKTSTAMHMIAEMVLHNAGRAKDASGNAGQVTRSAEESGVVMNQANDAMERITASSGKISNIIGLIDDIAFQTNLLALNASVEAARAGEAGKGFAVVAVEVRRLAQSAAEASRDVKVLIEQSATDVRGGSKFVAEAAGKLAAMVEAARSNTQLIEAIAQESHKQASAIEEVNLAVRTMDEMTQHNAALVEETNAAIEKTESQARELDRIVEVFATGKHAAAEDSEDHLAAA